MSLKQKAISGIVWVAVEQFGQQFLQLLIFIILARLLTPEDFGLIAIIMILISLSQILIDSGMGQALIRENFISDSDRSTVFWFNLILSLVFYCLLYFCAPIIANFFGTEEIVTLIRIMGLSVIFFGSAIIQRSELTQKLQFKKQAVAQLPAIIFGGVVSIIMAYIGYGVWSLVIHYLIVSVLSSLALWILAPASIRFCFDMESFKRLFSFGYKLLLSAILDTIYQNIYKIVIGKYFTATVLGLYTQSKKIRDLASQNIVSIIQKVTYPLLAKSKDDLIHLKRAYKQVIQVSSLIIFPVMILLIFLAEPLMIYILGKQWAAASPFLQIICVSGMIYHLHSINLNILKVLGRSDLFLKLEILKKIIITISILIGLQFGIYGLLISQVISSFISLVINSWYTAVFLDYSLKEQMIDVFSVLILCSPIVILLGIALFFNPVSSLTVLILYIFSSMIVYLLFNLLFRTNTVIFLLEILKPFTSKKLFFIK